MLLWDTIILIITILGGGYVCYMLGIADYFSRRKQLSANNKAVLVTGCDSGFGYSLAQRLSQLGYRVFAGCLFKDGEGANKLKGFSSKIVILQLDVTNKDDIKNICRSISEEKQDTELWAVVNNAGIMHMGEFEWCSMDAIRKVFEVNTFGMMNVTKEVLPLLRKSRGRVVNVTSINAEVRVAGSIGYSMSKAASKMFCDVLRLELRKWDIKVINICPYCYSTNLGSPKTIENMLTECWDKTDPNVRSAYGDEYMKEFQKASCRGIDILKNTHLEEVIDCMVDAISLQSPKLKYRPGNLLNRVLFSIPSCLPEFLVDSIQYFFMPKMKNNNS